MDARRLLLGIGVVAFVIIVSVAIFKIDWGGGSGPIIGDNQVNIADYANTDVKVQLTARGPINSDQEHQEMQITVGQNETVGELLSGYTGTVSRTQTTPSNSVAYKAFLSALHNAGFIKEKLARTDQQYDGACANGTRYTFEFLGADNGPKSTWATSCSKKDGTFDGDLSEVRSLFKRQLPDDLYDELVRKTIF